MNSPLTIIQLSPEELDARIEAAVVRALAKANVSPADADRLYTRQETAELLDISPQTLNVWEKRNQLKPIRKGARVYFKKSDIMKAT